MNSIKRHNLGQLREVANISLSLVICRTTLAPALAEAHGAPNDVIDGGEINGEPNAEAAQELYKVLAEAHLCLVLGYQRRLAGRIKRKDDPLAVVTPDEVGHVQLLQAIRSFALFLTGVPQLQDDAILCLVRVGLILSSVIQVHWRVR